MQRLISHCFSTLGRVFKGDKMHIVRTCWMTRKLWLRGCYKDWARRQHAAMSTCTATVSCAREENLSFSACSCSTRLQGAKYLIVFEYVAKRRAPRHVYTRIYIDVVRLSWMCIYVHTMHIDRSREATHAPDCTDKRWSLHCMFRLCKCTCLPWIQ